VTTLEDVGFKTAPYHALVPSFGEWGFILAGRQEITIAQKPVEIPNTVPQGDFLRGAAHWPKTRFLTPEILPDLFRFPADMARVPTEVNQLNNQVLVRYFEAEWRKVIR
jgi:spermidine synthase